MASNNNDSRSSVLSRPARRIIENFLLVWLDAHLDESTSDFKDSVAQLKCIVASIETYKDAQECIKFIQQVKDQKVFMIVSDTAGQHIVPAIHEWNQVYSIYVFCSNKPFHETWSTKYPKVKGVYIYIEPICKAVEIDRQRCDQDTISISFQNVDPLFMYTQLVKEAILQIKYDEVASLKDLVVFCRQQGGISEKQIALVEKEYNKHKPIWWYTAPIFMHSMLNRGLRVFDVDILMKMGFFMSQLDRHIQELSEQQHVNPKGLTIIGKGRFEVYRGQGLSTKDFEKLKKSKGGLMSFNNFLSTSYNKNVSLRDFARPAAFLTDSVGILFIMQIDTDLCMKAKIPFVEITGDIGYFKNKEAEILFTTHTLFKIEKLKKITDPHINRLYQVNLRVASPDAHELKEVADSLNEDIGSDTGFSRLAYILLKSGLSEQAGYIYNALLEKATTDHDIAEYNYQLGWVYKNLGEYEKAIQYYELNLEYKKKTLPSDDLGFAVSYNNIGIVYRNMGDYSKALSSYQKALEIQKQVLPPNHPDLAGSYNNIGIVYKNMGDYSKALECYQKALEIQKQVLPPNHPNLAVSYNSSGSVYYGLGDYSKALSTYQKSLEIRKQVLPPNHPDLTSSYNNIGIVYYNMGDYSKALSSYQKALEIQKQVLPPNHPDLAGSYNNIGIVYKNMGDYSKALECYQKALEIQKQVLPPNHPDLATSYNNIGSVYYSMGDYSSAFSSHEKALEIQKQALPLNHPDFAQSYNNIGMVYDNMGNYSDALEFYKQALSILEKSLPSTHAHFGYIYNGLGSVYDNMDDYSKALMNFETAVKIREKSLPSTHVDLATSYNDLGTTYAKMNMFTEASRLLEKAVNIRKKTLSATHPDLATSYWSSGLMYNGMGEYEKALSYHEQAVDIRVKALSANHSVLGKSYKEMGSVYTNMGNYTKALSCYEQALQIWQDSLPATHSNIASVKKDIEDVKGKMA